MTGRPSDYFRVVREHARKTRGFLLAERHPCLDIRDREVAAIHRDLRPAVAAALEDVDLPASWLLAIILCPGDDTVAVAAWAKGLPARDVDRIRFYAHPKVDLGEALAAWVEAGLPPPRVDETADWKEFHRRFGLHLNDLAYQDAARPSERA
jgi:hypothetical protein